jgi:hypothetical protein
MYQPKEENVAWLAVKAALFMALLVASLIVLLPSNARATEPYGGCDEAWQAPLSDGAMECRMLGWTVRPRLVIDPHGVVRAYLLPGCKREDSGRLCIWDAAKRGNHEGASFWRDGKGRTRFVWMKDPTDTGVWERPSWVDPALVQPHFPGFRVSQRCWWEVRLVDYDIVTPVKGAQFTVHCPDGRIGVIVVPEVVA